MKDQIIVKLTQLLNNQNSLNEEKVVYLLVELRKLLDWEKKQGVDNKESLIRFYTDWVVHTSKDYMTSTMTNIMLRIDDILTPLPRGGNLSFLLAPELKMELNDLFNKHDLPNTITNSGHEWKNFVWQLTQILSEQKLNNPTPNIKSFCFKPMDKDYIYVTIDFRDKRGSVDLGGHIDVL